MPNAAASPSNRKPRVNGHTAGLAPAPDQEKMDLSEHAGTSPITDHSGILQANASAVRNLASELVAKSAWPGWYRRKHDGCSRDDQPQRKEHKVRISIIKSRSKIALVAVASLLSASAATLVAFEAPASAASYVTLTESGTGGLQHQEFTCLAGTHAINKGEPIQVDNGCGVRVWLHQWPNGSGWSYCVSPHTIQDVPSKYQPSTQAYVSSNTAHC
jgi:hypothetical protein